MESKKYRISQIKLSLNEEKEQIPQKICKKIGKMIEIDSWEIVKESIDARRKLDIKRIYTIDFQCDENLNLPLPEKREISYEEEKIKKKILERERPIIVGFGPAGMFCALALAEMGLRPIVIERGKKAEERAKDIKKFFEKGILNGESNIQFGEGGAGTFSDGKLTTGINDIRIQKVLRELYVAGAPKEILYKQKPHIGTDVLIKVVKNIRNKIENLGGTIIFNSCLVEILSTNEKIEGVIIKQESGEKTILGKILVVATGQSSLDVYEILETLGVHMKQKPFSMGVRVVHPQNLINKAQYGDAKLAEKLGAAEYKLSHKASNGRGVYTFCMCPGGEVIMASSGPEEIVINGMSNSKRDGLYANSAVLVEVRTEDFGTEGPLAGLDYRRNFEKKAFELNGCEYKPIKTTWKEFQQEENILRKALPTFVVEGILEAMHSFGKKITGFDNEDTVLLGIETRTSSPVKVCRDENLQANIMGLYPAGEGAGAAGGIMSAAVDGLKIAEKIHENY